MDTTGHIVWDWNGTLLDDVHASVASINAVLLRRHHPPISLRTYRDTFCFPVRRCYEKLGVDLSGTNWDRITVEFHAAYRRFSAGAPLRRGILPLLRTLHRRGCRLSILSASENGLLQQMVAARGIRRFFSRIAGLNDYQARSKREIALTLASESMRPPGHTLLVGDTDHDFEVARELGWQCLLLTGGHQAARRLRACQCPVVTEGDPLRRWIEAAIAPRTNTGARKAAENRG